MTRPQRKAAANRPIIVESDDEGPQQRRKSISRRKSTVHRNSGSENDEESSSTQTRSARMKEEEEEIFVQMCVNNFDKINDMSILRGINISASRNKNNEAWAELTANMNEITGVSKQQITFHSDSVIVCIFQITGGQRTRILQIEVQECKTKRKTTQSNYCKAKTDWRWTTHKARRKNCEFCCLFRTGVTAWTVCIWWRTTS